MLANLWFFYALGTAFGGALILSGIAVVYLKG